METYIYKKLFDSYNENVENKTIWDKLRKELEKETDSAKLKNLEEFVTEKLDVFIKKELLEKKGYTKIEDNHPIIYIELTNPNKINRFTIAHELAHIIFDYTSLEKGELLFSDYYDKELFHDYSEVRANQFAAELLMPTILIRNIVEKMFEEKRTETVEKPSLTTDEVIPIIMKECEVSYTAVENRLRNLGMVN